MESSGNKRKICSGKEEDENEEVNVERFCELLKNISDSDNHWMNSSSLDILKAADLSSPSRKKTRKKEKKKKAKEEESNKAWRPTFLPEDFTEDHLNHQLHPCKAPSAETPPIKHGGMEVKDMDEKLDLNLSL